MVYEPSLVLGKVKARTLLLFFGLLIVIILAIGLLNDPLRLNLAHLQMNRLMFSSSANPEAYRALLYATGKRYTRIRAEHERTLTKPYSGCSSGSSSLVAWLMAKQSHYQRDFAQTGMWLLKAAEEFPNRQVNLPVMLPAHVAPEPNTGNVQLMWDATYWSQRAHSPPLDVQSDPDSQVLTLSYENRLMVRDKVTYALRGPINLAHWHEIQVVSKVRPGTYLTLEVRTEKGLNRYMNYHQGTGEWETFILPLEGTVLRNIYILMNEPVNAVEATEYEIQLMPITFHLKPELQICMPAQ